MNKNEYAKLSKAIDLICDAFEEHGGGDREAVTDALFDLASGQHELEEAVRENL